MKTSRPAFVVAWVTASLITNLAHAFSITSVTLWPGNPVPPAIPVKITVDIATPSQPPVLYAPTQVSSNASGLHVDIFPDSGLMTVLGSIRETVTLGTFPSGTYHYQVVLHPGHPVGWGTLTNSGTFTVLDDLPVVSLEAVDLAAAETRIDQNAIFWAEFRVLRTGPATNELAVFLDTQQGSARLGEDYWLDGVSNRSTVRFPAGAKSVKVRLYPIDDDFYEGDETVLFHLIEPPSTSAPYKIDLANSSVSMVIHDNDPATTRLDITAPHDGESFKLGDVIELRAQIIGPGVSNELWGVEFFDGDQSIGTTVPGKSIWWSDASGGQHVISARAINSQGTILTAATSAILVGPGATLPVVKIIADPWSTGEPCPVCLVAPSILTIERTAPTNTALKVFLEIGGTAIPGDDYQALPASVEIPAGKLSTQLTILARDDQLAEGPEVVRVRLLPQPPPLLPPTYFVNVHANEALVTIFDDEANAPQARLDIIAPTNGSHLAFPSVIQLSALAVNTKSEVYGPVEFYAAEQLIARSPVVDATTRPAIPGLASIHTAYWTNPPVGQYDLTARSLFSLNQSITSPPVRVTVDLSIFPVVSLQTLPVENPQALEFCPPNTLCAYPSFVVHRTGPTNADLRVYLSYSGTATANVDYPAFPDSLVIPAGSDHASLMLVPKDDTLIEGPETVIASFTPVPGPGYMQNPNHASATITILDNDSPKPTVVSILAEDSLATELPPWVDAIDPARFRISRSGDISRDLRVFVSVGGSATTGVDYQALTSSVLIPAGTDSTTLVVWPVYDELKESLETVVATISECPPPGIELPCYDFVIDPAQETATVFIRDDGNTEVSLTITAPTNRAGFKSGEIIPIKAEAIDLESYISRVEFFDGDLKIGVSEIVFIQAPTPGTPIQHSFNWQGAAPGSHILTARAIRSTGELVVSQPVEVMVRASGNQLPAVAIIQPVKGTEFPPNHSIEITVETRDPDGYVRTMEFYADGRKLGEITVVFIRPPDPGQLQKFIFVWQDPEPGSHILTARASDDTSDSAVSKPIEIRVTLDSLPTIAVRATDCFAVEPSSNGVLNTATFRLRRFGSTNAPLTVLYSMHGTAQNGVDYEMLPGSAIIPAGSFSTTITIRPLADNMTEHLETVVLLLEDQPQYNIGLRRKAVALVSDFALWTGSEVAGWTRLTDGCFHGAFIAPANGNYRVEASTDLLTWETVAITAATEAAVHFVEDQPENFPSRFYRLAPEPNSAADE